MGFSLRADHVCDSVFDIKGSDLAAMGIRLLLSDLDNTLVPYGVAVATDEIIEWNNRLNAAGVTLFVLSNNRRADRPRIFSRSMGVPFLGHAGKPKTKGFLEAMERMGVSAKETAIIGDQIFTDVLGGNLAGVMTILVKPIQLAGNPGRYLRYAAELPFRAISGKGKGLME